MKLFGALLGLRYQQLCRIIKELGILRTLIILLLFGVIFIELTQRLWSDNQAIICIILGWITVSLAHSHRQDKSFFKSFEITPNFIFFGEYALYSLPFLIVLFLVHQFMFGGIYLIGIFVISWIPHTVSSRGKALPIPFISARHYEIISGVRQIYIYLIIIYLLGIFLAKFVAIIPIILFILTSLFIEFNIEGEPQEFLEILGVSPRQFLALKIRYQLYFFVLLFLPLAILFILFHFQYWWMLLLILMYSMLIITLSVLGKYHFYRPNARISEPSVFNMLFLYGGFFVPVMLPVIILLSLFFMVRTYRKALANLKIYLIDYQ